MGRSPPLKTLRKAVRLLPLILKHATRRPARSLLVVSGVALAMFLFSAVKALENGVRRATEVTAEDTTLVVYRENRYCPFTSQLPEHYKSRIEAVAGVESAIPVRIAVSNCRASLDVVTFRGVPETDLVEHLAPGLDLVEGSVEEWRRRSDAALVGESLARRRGVGTGGRLSAAGITVHVAGIIRSEEPQERNVAYTHLAFLQEATHRGGTGGIVTQFNVRVADPALLDEVARAIDAEFASDSHPTSTWPEKSFVAQAASEVLELVHFAGWLGWGALLAVFALVANGIVLAVQERMRDHAVLQTLGYSQLDIAFLIVGEGVLASAAGGLAGTLAAVTALHYWRFSLTTEGLNIEVAPGAGVLALGFTLSLALGVAAGLVPAVQASRREIAGTFRAV